MDRDCLKKRTETVNQMANGIYNRKGKNGDVTYYIRYQVDGADIKERLGRKSRGFTRDAVKGAVVSPELKEASGATFSPKLAQNRNVF
jgi:hypothetical protein